MRSPSSNASGAGGMDAEPAGDRVYEVASVPAAPVPAPAAAPQCASHAALFAANAESRCDACGAPLPADAAEREAQGVVSAPAYMWTRGGEVRLEDARLCASCASAVGMTALGRWEIEEEEG